MTTRVYGASDDLVEIEGDITGEVGCYGTDDRGQGVLLIFDDGTLLEVKYGKNDAAIWEVRLIQRGKLFDRIDQCDDEDASIHSDQAFFKSGLKKAYAATGDWEKVH